MSIICALSPGSRDVRSSLGFDYSGVMIKLNLDTDNTILNSEGQYVQPSTLVLRDGAVSEDVGMSRCLTSSR